MSGLGPFDLDGPHFLRLFGVLMALVWLAGMAIPRWLRADGAMARPQGAEEAAYLAGGATRLAEAVVTAMLARGAARIAEGRVLAQSGTTRAERVVAGFGGGASWRELTAALKEECASLAVRLEANGLLMGPREQAEQRFFQTLPYFLLLLFGAAKWTIGHARDRPVGILTGLLAVTVIAALVRWFLLDPRTRAGVDAVAEQRQAAANLRRGALREESALAVALFGTAVLVGSPLGDLHRLRSGGGDGGSAGGCSGGDGGGGGGCGGCGS